MEAMERQYLEGTISVFTEESCSAGHLTVCSAQKDLGVCQKVRNQIVNQ